MGTLPTLVTQHLLQFPSHRGSVRHIVVGQRAPDVVDLGAQLANMDLDDAAEGDHQDQQDTAPSTAHAAHQPPLAVPRNHRVVAGVFVLPQRQRRPIRIVTPAGATVQPNPGPPPATQQPPPATLSDSSTTGFYVGTEYGWTGHAAGMPSSLHPPETGLLDPYYYVTQWAQHGMGYAAPSMYGVQQGHHYVPGLRRPARGGDRDAPEQ